MRLGVWGSVVGVLVQLAGCGGATCGDGFVHQGEGCDDGNNEDNDGCSRLCQVE